MRRMLCTLAILIAANFCTLPAVLAATDDPIYRFHPGIHFSQKQCLTNHERRFILAELRRITAFDLRDDEDGNLTFTDHHPDGGSNTARELIRAAIRGNDSFTIAATNHSNTVAFAQLESVLRYNDGMGNTHEDWQIRIDFADFEELQGDNQALASFGPGFGILHELVHAVANYPDPLTESDQLGSCERYLNSIRAELGLPQRLIYYPMRQLAVSRETQLTTFLGKLVFGWPEEMGRERKKMFVTFNLDRVCESPTNFSLSRAEFSRPVRLSGLVNRRTTN
jgi:hypothetical protein